MPNEASMLKPTVRCFLKNFLSVVVPAPIDPSYSPKGRAVFSSKKPKGRAVFSSKKYFFTLYLSHSHNTALHLHHSELHHIATKSYATQEVNGAVFSWERKKACYAKGMNRKCGKVILLEAAAAKAQCFRRKELKRQVAIASAVPAVNLLAV